MQTALPLLARPSQSKSCWPHLCHRSLLHLRRSNGIGKEQNLFEQASSYKFFLHGAWSACDPASQVFNPGSCRLAHLNTQTPKTPRTPRAKNSTTTAENKRVGRRWSPPGGLQLNKNNVSTYKRQTISTSAGTKISRPSSNCT